MLREQLTQAIQLDWSPPAKNWFRAQALVMDRAGQLSAEEQRWVAEVIREFCRGMP